MWNGDPRINYNTVYNAWKVIDLNIREKDEVVILSSPDRNQNWNNLLATMVVQKGAEPVMVLSQPHTVGRGMWDGRPPESGAEWSPGEFLSDIDWHAARTLPVHRALPAVLKSADVIIHNYGSSLTQSPDLKMKGSGVKWILMPDILGLRDPVRMDEKDLRDVDERVIKYSKMFDAASSYRLETGGETLTGSFEPGRKALMLKYIFDENTSVIHGHSGLSGECFNCPQEDNHEGSIIVNGCVGHVGDVREPLKLTFKEGRVVEITPEDDPVATDFKKILDMNDDPNNYVMGELALGCNHMSRRHAPPAHTHEVKKALGGVHIGIGGNVGTGGANEAFVHIDVAMFGANLFLDDEPVLKDGELVK